MFWGLIMEPGRCYTQTVKVSFHVSMAALDISNSSDDPAQVMCVFEGRNYLLCTLKKKEMIQCPLDLNFEAGTKVSFATNGKAHVHLTGYLTNFGDDDLDEAEEEEEEEEEEDVKAVVKKEKKRTKKPTTEGPPTKKSKTIKNSHTLNSEEAEEEESDSDFDIDKLIQVKSDDEEESEDGEEGEEEEEEDEDDEDVEEEASSLSGDEESEEEEQSVKPKQNGLAKTSQVKKNKEQKVQEKTTKQKKQEDKKEQPQKQKPKKSVLKGGVIVEDIKEGSGDAVKEGKFVHVYYEGRLKENNKMFDSTTKGPGFSFRIGKGEVIKGWDIGLVGMKVGGKRRITCPPKVAYGPQGSPPVIPPNATLVFDVELKKIS